MFGIHFQKNDLMVFDGIKRYHDNIKKHHKNVNKIPPEMIHNQFNFSLMNNYFDCIKTYHDIPKNDHDVIKNDHD